MEYLYDCEVREHAFLEHESVLHMLRPGKKAFFFYRVRIPSVLLGVAALALLAVNVLYTAVSGLSFSGTLYIALAVLAVPAMLVNYTVQKKLYQKRAYYITDKRVLAVGGVFHLKYQTLHYRFIGSAVLKRTLFAGLFGLESHTISLILNVNKQFSVKFFSLSGNMLSYLEAPDEAYKQIVRSSAAL